MSEVWFTVNIAYLTEITDKVTASEIPKRNANSGDSWKVWDKPKALLPEKVTEVCNNCAFQNIRGIPGMWQA